MKKLLLLSGVTLCLGAAPSFATDGFGAHFTDQAPAGFGDMPSNDDAFTTDAFDPASIEPAAGEEDQVSPQSDQEPQIESEEEAQADPSQSNNVTE